MKTLEMMYEAFETGKTYISGDMQYSTENGFCDEDTTNPWSSKAFDTINEIMELTWSPLKIGTYTKKMTLKQIEEKLGYRIELVSE